MRIIGGRDFYDSAMGYGQDRDRVFVRSAYGEGRVLPCAGSALRRVGSTGLALRSRGKAYDVRLFEGGYEHRFQPFVVWFAGCPYPGVRRVSLPVASGERDNHTYWSAKELLDDLARRGSGLADYSWNGTLMRKVDVESFFAREATATETDWMVANRVSIAVSQPLDPTLVRWDPHDNKQQGWLVDVDGLGALGFARRLDPYQAFQRLSMWVGGVLPTAGAEVVEIASDDVRRDKHGFDRWSFRKRKDR